MGEMDDPEFVTGELGGLHFLFGTIFIPFVPSQ